MKRKNKNRRPAAPARAKTSIRKAAKARSTPAKQARTKTSRDKVRAHRARLRKRGFRLVQMWLPDTRTKEFAEQAHKASLAIANSPTEAEDQAFVDSVSWWNSPEAAELEKSEPPTPWWRTDGQSD
jgi:Antitoxin MazE-like